MREEVAHSENCINKGYLLCYGILLRLGGSYNGFHGGTTHAIYRAYSYFVLVLFSGTLILFAVSVSVVTDRSEFFHIWHLFIMIMYGTFCNFNTLRHEHNIRAIYLKTGSNFFDYADSTDPLTVLKRKIDKYIDWFVKFWISSVVFVASSTDVFGMCSQFIRKEYLNRTDGINYLLPVPFYLPFDSTTTTGYLVAFIYEVIVQFIFVCIICGQDLTFVCFCINVCFQLKVLQNSINNIERRAVERCRIVNPDDKIYSAPNFIHEFQFCLKQNIFHHKSIIECYHHIQSWISTQLMITFYSGAFMICMAGIILTEGESFVEGVKIPTLITLFAELLHVLLFCLLGEEVRRLGHEIGNCLYFTNWFKIKNRRIRYEILMIQMRSRCPLAISSAGVIFAYLSTFTQVLSTSYSFFNLIRAARNK